VGAAENKAAVAAALEAFNAGDFERYKELYGPSLVVHGFGPDDLDLDGMMAFYETVAAGFEGISVATEDALAEGDRVAYRYTFRATHAGEFMGVPATGRAVTVPGQTILRFKGGKCVERWQAFDLLSLLTQIGAVPALA
jgi:steroid delta-isomerase-like uncharacterized protein